MNEHMRRYLDEDWEADKEPEQEERETKRIKPATQDRRQQEKQRGKAIAKFHRDTAKHRKRTDQ